MDFPYAFLILFAVLQESAIPANNLVARISEQVFEGIVDPDDGVVEATRIGNDDRIVDGFHRAFEQPQPHALGLDLIHQKADADPHSCSDRKNSNRSPASSR